MKRFIILSSILLMYSTTIVCAGGLNESFWGEVKSSQVLPVENLYSHKIVNDRLVMHVGNPRDSSSYIKILDANTLEEIFRITGINHVFHLSYGDNPCIVALRNISEGHIVTSAYDLDGEHLFTTKALTSALLPSPNGDYFYMINDMVGPQNFLVLSRAGELLFDAEKIKSKGWVSIAMNDSVVALINSNLDFYNVFSGQKIKTMPNPILGAENAMKALLSPSSVNLLLYSYAYYAVIDSSLNIIRVDENDRDYIINTGFSRDGKFLALFKHELGVNGVQQIVLLNSSTGEQIWSENLYATRAANAEYLPGIIFDKNKIYIKTYQPNYYYSGRLYPTTSTHIFSIDPNTGSLLGKTKEEGIIDVFEKSNGGIRLFNVTKKDSLKVMTIYELE